MEEYWIKVTEKNEFFLKDNCVFYVTFRHSDISSVSSDGNTVGISRDSCRLSRFLCLMCKRRKMRKMRHLLAKKNCFPVCYCVWRSFTHFTQKRDDEICKKRYEYEVHEERKEILMESK